MRIVEGAKVAWVGPEVDGYEVGDSGSLLAFASGAYAHVTWATGSHSGETEIVSIEDISTGHVAAKDPLADSLDMGGLVSFSARQVMDTEGEAGVLNAMASMGHLTAFSSIAEDVMSQVAAQVRQDPSFRAVASQLDEDEAEALIRLATTCLIRDAFTEET